MMGRVVVGAKVSEMGNQSTGTESKVSSALVSPFDERNIAALLSYHNSSNWCASTGKPESTTSNASTMKMVMSSTGTPDAGKERKLLPMHTRRWELRLVSK